MRQKNFLATLLVALLALLGFVAAACANHAPQSAPKLDFRIVRELPHDIAHYTQGLALHDGQLIESAGRYGESALYVKDLTNGRVLRRAALPIAHFAEGLAIARGRIVLLTWRERIAHVFDAATLAARAPLAYAGEGWGLAFDGESLVMSNGSANLAFRDPGDFALRREIVVREDGQPVTQLNELEFARGAIFANQWLTDRIAVIDPGTGRLRAWLDLSALRERFVPLPGFREGDHVLNGIAWDAARDRFYVTGKCWPVLFELEVGPLP
jgi:glutamine cyclotransferase